MQLDAIRALYDRYQRIDIEYVGTRKEVTPRVVRIIEQDGQAAVIYSQLDETTADETIREEIAHFTQLGIAEGMEWKLFDYDRPADLKQRLIAHGFVPQEPPDAVLVLALDALPDRLAQPARHDIRRITDARGLDDVFSIQSDVWNEDHTFLRARLETVIQTKPEALSIYCAYVDGVPASAGWIDFAGAPFAGLWGGSTREAYRGRGLYTALVAVRAQEARNRGFRFLTIDASPMSRAILEKLGFRLLALAYQCNYHSSA